MPHEFLFLMCNARPRLEEMEILGVPENDNKKVKLSDFFDGEERRPDLEARYPYDIKGNSKRLNPREQLIGQHVLESTNCRIRINDMRNLFYEMAKTGSHLEADTVKAMKKEQ